ncbi:MAG TPA: hypothetical protein VIO14_08230 [Dehalococcoidia bacterium]
MIRRTLPAGYNSSEGRLVYYGVSLEGAEETQQDLWRLTLEKQYVPWETWTAFCRGFGLDTWRPERPSVEEVTTQLQHDDDAMRGAWRFVAHQRAFHVLPAAAPTMLEETLPFLNDPSAYQWRHVKSIMVAYIQDTGLEYPRLADPRYFQERREEAQALWALLHSVAQVMGAKWELAWGETARDPDPEDLSLPRFQPYDTLGWYLAHFAGELRVDDRSIDAFVQASEPAFFPFQEVRTVEDAEDVYGEAMDVAFGAAWEARYGHGALLADLERALATPEEILRLHWLRHLRLGG